ncbi:MAG: hypothetical protein F4W92_10890 [Gammaproteobacteria bacterium]|nr:hypothetical protein [Gammaproteobacteria bacterium]
MEAPKIEFDLNTSLNREIKITDKKETWSISLLKLAEDQVLRELRDSRGGKITEYLEKSIFKRLLK